MAIKGLMILVLGAAVLGTVLLLLRLLRSERTRAVLKTLVAVPVVFMIPIIAYAILQRNAVVHHHVPATVPMPVAPSGDWDLRPVDAAHSFDQREVETVGDESGKSGDKTGRLLWALAGAMVHAIAEDPKGGVPENAADAVKRSPASEIELSPDPNRPKWVDASGQQVGGVYRTTAAVGPYTTRAECERELPRELRAAVDEYVEIYLGPNAVHRVELPLDYVREKIVEEEWLETRQVTVSPTKQVPMVRLHVLLGFDREVNGRLDQAWRRAVVHGKLWALGTAGSVALLVLSTFWGYLKTDLATRGAYRGRLRFATGLAVALVLLIGLAVLRSVGV